MTTQKLGLFQCVTSTIGSRKYNYFNPNTIRELGGGDQTTDILHLLYAVHVKCKQAGYFVKYVKPQLSIEGFLVL